MPPTPPDTPPGLASWPGLDGGETDVDTHEVRSLAQRLEGYVESVLSTASKHLKAAGEAGPDDYGAWDAAAQLHGSVATTQAVLTDHHLRFLESVMAVVRKLNRTAHIYDAREKEIEAKIAKVARSLEDSPPPASEA